MEEAKQKALQEIGNILEKYADQYSEIKEKAKKAKNTTIFNQNDLDLPKDTNDEDFSSFDEIQRCFNKYKSHNKKMIRLIDDINGGKYDNVFSYYNNDQDSSPVTNNYQTPHSNVDVHVPDDYPLIMRRKQRKDIETIPDPQMVLNFPTTSSLTKKVEYPAQTFQPITPIQQEHAAEVPLRKSIVQKKRQAPSIRSVLIPNPPSNNSPNKNSDIQSPTAKEILPVQKSSSDLQNILVADSISLSQKTDRDKQEPPPLHFSQPSVPLKFLELYRPDPPQVFPPPLSAPLLQKRFQNINKTNDDSTISNTEKENNISQKEETANVQSPHFLSSSSSTNSSIPTDNYEPDSFSSPIKSFNQFNAPAKSSNPFVSISESANPIESNSQLTKFIAPSEKQNLFITTKNPSDPTTTAQKSSNPFDTPHNSLSLFNKTQKQSNLLVASQKTVNPFTTSQNVPKQTTVINNNQVNPFSQNPSNSLCSPQKFTPILTSPNTLHFLSSNSDNVTSNSSSSQNSSNSSQISIIDPSSSIHKSINHETDEEGQDSIINSPLSSTSTQKIDDSNVIKPIITGEDVISSSEMRFLSDDDSIQIENNNSENIEENEAVRNIEKIIEVNDQNEFKSKEEKKSDSSSDVDESNLSQTLQQSGFIFNNNSVQPLGNMVQSSENPYMKLDAITRLPIKK